MKPPPENLLKLNVDAAFKDEEAGIGMVLRNSKGELEAVLTDYLPKCLDAQLAETIEFVKALQFAKEYGITHFELEGDALGVINRIYSNQVDLSPTGHLTEGIRDFLKDFLAVTVSYVHRSGNSSAHAAANLALKSKS